MARPVKDGRGSWNLATSQQNVKAQPISFWLNAIDKCHGGSAFGEPGALSTSHAYAVSMSQRGTNLAGG